MKPVISVVVPVYNTDKFLAGCVESIRNQTYENIEIILVDDGSTDDSPQICDDFQKKDERIVVLHQKNQGSTKARKEGVAASKGDYIGFVDSDDWIEPQMYEQMLDMIDGNKADIVASGMIIENYDNYIQSQNHIGPGVYNKKEMTEKIYPNMLYDDKSGEYGILSNLCNKLFARNIISHNLLKQAEEIYYGEDLACVITCFLDSDVVCLTDKAWYHYHIREGSTCNLAIGEKYWFNIWSIYNYLYNDFQTRDNKETLLYQLKNFMIGLNDRAMKMLFDISYSNFWSFPFEEIKKGQKIIIYGAGAVGKSYVKQLEGRREYEVVLWVDKCTGYNRSLQMEIRSRQDIGKTEFDCLLIALCDETIVEEVKQGLIRDGVPAHKILWKKPVRLKNVFIMNVI